MARGLLGGHFALGHSLVDEGSIGVAGDDHCGGDEAGSIGHPTEVTLFGGSSIFAGGWAAVAAGAIGRQDGGAGGGGDCRRSGLRGRLWLLPPPSRPPGPEKDHCETETDAQECKGTARHVGSMTEAGGGGG